MGKTSLVCEAVRKAKGVKLLYVDLLGIRSISDFGRKVTSSFAALFDIGRIDDKDFSAFLIKRFKTGKRTVDPVFIEKVLNLADRVSGDVQELCGAIWATTGDGTTLADSDLPKALELVFARESKSYIPAIGKLTAIQMRVLRGIAELGGEKILSGDFLRAVNVPNAGSVRKSVFRLIDLDILYEFDGRYRFTNPFFRRMDTQRLILIRRSSPHVRRGCRASR